MKNKKLTHWGKFGAFNHSFKEGNNKMLLFCNDIACFSHTGNLDLITHTHIHTHVHNIVYKYTAVVCIWNFSPDSCVWILGPQLVALLGKVVEPLGGEAALENMGHWGCVVRIVSLLPTLLPEYSYKVTSQPLGSCLVPCLLHHGGLYLSANKIKPSTFKLLLSAYLIPTPGKETHGLMDTV